MNELEETLGYTFRDATLLERALTSPACKMSSPDMPDNQRLEFLGDAVLGLLAADALYAVHPDEPEGALTMRRARLVSGSMLAATAERMGLRKWLRRNVGAHELPVRAKALADALEAVMGAVWLDGGLQAAKKVFDGLGLPVNERLNDWSANPKGFLQMKAQALHPPRRPVYTVIDVTGPSHDPVVTVSVSVEGLGTAKAVAGSKTAAEVAAAASLLEGLG